MKNLLLMAIIAIAMTIGANAKEYNLGTTYDSTKMIKDGSEIALGYGEYSPSTGRPATNYVKPYTKSNGTYVNGYYRS